ncbi:ATP synthase mitochondrial F1 complex assembly factor 1-like [Limulus polyphemus]|uniref:ATP synthase mitochondrial F1 complex assembly factor 1-like n=1 Tax=Limulus polyphemus TaxID=6850 RepID=A0ABM1BXE2_LIMPO|nr:ATP synthase mitochondrial F1 complex assembly factor 1-like [Limulus polyphemus]
MMEMAREWIRQILWKRMMTFSNRPILFRSSLYHVFGGSKNQSRLYSSDQEGLQSNPFFKKYEDKIAALQKSSPEEFSRLLQNVKENQNANPVKKLSVSLKDATTIANEETLGISKTRDLNKILKVNLLDDKTPEEISQIWMQYHESKSGLFAVIPANTYKKIYENAKLFPTFIYLVPRKEGYELFVGQFVQNECHFTQLIKFQSYKENAPPCLTIIHYPELQDTKDIVLMSGQHDEEVLKIEEAQCLVHQFQLYYGQEHGERHEILKTFNKDPNKFSHMDVIKEFKKCFG